MGDYYAEGQKVAGEWFGQGAEKTHRVQPLAHPQTGFRILAVAQRDKRLLTDDTLLSQSFGTQGESFPFTFSAPPKSNGQHLNARGNTVSHF